MVQREETLKIQSPLCAFVSIPTREVVLETVNAALLD